MYELYFDEQQKYSHMYGPKTIVFMQVGKFYEAYCTKTKGYVNLEELEGLLNIRYIDRKDHDTKPSQFGINEVSITRNITTLVENGYTIALFNQKVPNENDNIERECVGVFSKGTYISEKQTSDSNYLLSVYIAEERQLNKKSLLAVGITLVDVTTGKSLMHEFYSHKLDEKFGLDELVRIIQTFRPIESIIYYHPLVSEEESSKYIKSYLELNKLKNCYFCTYNTEDSLNILTEELFKINYQNNYLSKIFNFNTQLTLKGKHSAIEILNLEKKTYCTISLMIALKYVSEHNVLLLRNLSNPEIYMYHKHLILGNNAVEQLNIIDSNNLESYNHNMESLFNVINKTSTPMGKRFLKENLVNPLSQENKETIIKRYDLIEQILKGKLCKPIIQQLKNIYDMERLHRRMAMGSILPYEFYRLDLFYKFTGKIISVVKKNEVLKNIIPNEMIKNFASYQEKYRQEFEFEELKKCSNFADIEKSFFKKGIHTVIDNIQDKIEYGLMLVKSINAYFSDLISSNQKKKGVEILKIDSNEREGYFYTISKYNEKILKQKLEQKEILKIELSNGKIIELNKKDIEFKPLKKGRTKIFITSISEDTISLSNQLTKLSKLIKKLFIKSMMEYYTIYKTLMHSICRFVSEVDFLVSGALVADNYYYCKPIIPSDNNIASYLKAKNLRHAIVERLCIETEYVPNDIELGNVPDNEEIKKNGILLYGENSCGKSVTMKSIGIAIILAQIGYYVPAEEFIYEPYMSLYARITANDNIFKGLSNFTLEITELNAILIRIAIQGTNTLVIGDEICRGTEAISGISIVASTLISLSTCNCSFIFSSHLHHIPSIEEIKNLNNLRIFHLETVQDKKNNCLIFNRKLLPGKGPSVYGLTIARYLIKDTEFINRAEIIKDKLLKENIGFSNKTSNYNKKLIVNRCSICGYIPKKTYHKELESHHINFKKNCCEDGKIQVKPYLTKNQLYNLVVLCRKCHVGVHQGEITIRGYVDTSIGPILDYDIDFDINIRKSLATLDKIKNKIMNK